MKWKFIPKLIKQLKRRKKLRLVSYWLVFLIAIFVYAGHVKLNSSSINPAAFMPLLHLIAQAESNDNYNAYFGNSTNASVNFTSMSVAQVLDWQANFVRQGSPSSAVGRYQIINTTLDGLVRQLDIDTNEKFDESMQDRLAIALLERRGAREYANDKLSREEFAANLAKEWAALPKVVGENPNESYYASDGLNKSRIEISEILGVIDQVNT